MSTRSQLDELMAQIQEMWGHLDSLFEELNESDGWEQEHGTDWTFADVPYHLTYWNDDIITRGIELGPDYPQEEQKLLVTPEDINAWNAQKMGERPFYQTPVQSVSGWQASCEKIYRCALRMNDADLDRPFWMPLVQGWVAARDGLGCCRDHDRRVYGELQLHMERVWLVPCSVMAS